MRHQTASLRIVNELIRAGRLADAVIHIEKLKESRPALSQLYNSKLVEIQKQKCKFGSALTSVLHKGERAAGIASIPCREDGLRHVIQSLSGQVDEFHIYLNNYGGIPPWLASLPRTTIYTSEMFGNIGDAGKFFGYDRTKADWYFTCDDDIIYPSDYTDQLIAAYQRHDCPVGVHGSLLRFENLDYYDQASRHVLHFKWKNVVEQRVHILGTGTMLFNRKQIHLLPQFSYPNMADIWIAKFMASNGVPLYAVARPDGWLKEVKVPEESIYSDNLYGKSDQRLIVNNELQHIRELVRSIKGKRKKVMVGIKTFNRIDYLKECIASFLRTSCHDRFDIVVAVADDGSTDGSIEYLEALKIPFELHIIKNQRAYVSGQFNSLVRLGQSLDTDFYFILDDDVYFKKSGWMQEYYDAAVRSGFDHLCHFNLPHFKQICEQNKEAFPPPRRDHKEFSIESYATVRRAMGAFFTLSAASISKVGFADEVNFFVRGGWHADYSARCCRAGFNETERFWDLAKSNDYVELQNTRTESYKTSIAWESEEFKRASTPQERKRREIIKANPRRCYIGAVDSTEGKLLSPQGAESHLPFTVNEVFDRVFVINLDRRPDRMSNMERSLRRHEIRYERFSALDGSAGDIHDIYRNYKKSRPAPRVEARLSSKEFFFGGRTDAERTAHVEVMVGGPAIRSAGAMAYLLTYKNILRRCIEENINRVLILDDDCLFHKEFTPLFSKTYSELPSKWKIFQLGTMQYNWPLVETYSEHLYLPHGVLVASHAVGLHRDTYPVLLDGISRMTLPFDIGPLQDCARIFTESSFVSMPNLIIQDQSESDINSSDVAKGEAEKKNNIYRWGISSYE
jgi:glycosyltransferase involved in cell wall biosynthesis